jgi:hypothetical protein
MSNDIINIIKGAAAMGAAEAIRKMQPQQDRISQRQAEKEYGIGFIRRHADRLREACRRSCPRNTVQSFIPPVVCGNSQPGNLRRIIAKLRHLLSRRHP